MTYDLEPDEFETVMQLDADDRYDYFVERIVESEEIWGLSSGEGFVMFTADGDECLPVWPHPDFAAKLAVGDWADCVPQSILLKDWLEDWIPGMVEDGVSLAIFTDENEEGVVVSPADIEASILDELEQDD